MSILKKLEQIPKKSWKCEYPPERTLLNLGFDKEQNPCYLIFYGTQQFKSNNDLSLENKVTYYCYGIFRGKNGHLPSFPKISIMNYDWNRETRSYDTIKMYYRNKENTYYGNKENYLVKEFVSLPKVQQFDLDYYSTKPLEEQIEYFVEELSHKNISIPDFTLIKEPKEILPLEESNEYFDLLYDLITNESLYMRKKRLNEILSMNPPKEILTLLLSIGNSEIISGLFLELAKRKNPLLLEDAKLLQSGSCDFAGGYSKGLKRCLTLYLNTLNPEKREQRIGWIYKHHEDMNLQLTNIRGEPIVKEFTGKDYFKYMQDGCFWNSYGYYDQTTRKYINKDLPMRYEKSIFSNGYEINVISVKNLIQEAEIYQMGDVLGKIAYYFDSPRLYYSFHGTGKSKSFNYFRRYIRRILDSYITENPDKFMEAMVSLLTSYTNEDLFRKFDYIENIFIRYYLYFIFEKKAPKHITWDVLLYLMSEKELNLLRQRKLQIKRIFEEHMEDVVEILIKSKCDDVLKPCFAFLIQSEQKDSILDKLTYATLISLAASPLDVIRDYFYHLLEDKLNKLPSFDSKLMLLLIDSSDKNIVLLGKEYKTKTKGKLAPKNLVSILFTKELADWLDMIKEDLLSYQEEDYIVFIKELILSSSQFLASDNFTEPSNPVLTEWNDILTLSTMIYQNSKESVKKEFLSYLIQELQSSRELPTFLTELLEKLLFSLPFDELTALLGEITLESKKRLPLRNKQILSFIQAIQSNSLPSDAQILNILGTSSSKMIKTLIEALLQKENLLKEKTSTLFLMLESDITILNRKAEEVFDQLQIESQRKLHSQILDSPVPKVYQFGIQKLNQIYGSYLPKEFLISLLEHPALEVKTFISDKIDSIFQDLEHCNQDLFLYYVKSLLLIPNKISKGKDDIYKVIPEFIKLHGDKYEQMESLLLEIGHSNCMKDAERALTTLVQTRKAVAVN